MLQVDIEKTVGSFQLRVKLESENEILALLGASGCGKSMTLKCIAGIMTPDRGRIALNGRVLFDSEAGINLTPQQRRVGYLFQQYALFPNMTVAQNIAAGLHHLSRQERAAAVTAYIQAFHLEGLERHRPAQLSGGQQQRVALARILASEPEVLLLDEPFSALDSYLKWELELELMDTLKGFQGEVLFVSHSRDEVCRMCETVCVLNCGQSEPKASVAELMRTPGTVSAALLSGCKNFSVAERIDDQTVHCADWGVTLRSAVPITASTTHIGIRAHYIIPGEAAENVIECRVARVVDNVFSTIIMLETPGGTKGRSLLRMEMDQSAWRKLSGVEVLRVHVAPSDVLPLLGEGI